MNRWPNFLIVGTAALMISFVFIGTAGYLAGTGLYLSYAHTKEELDKYFVAVDEVFESISVLEKEGTDIKSKLWGEVCHGGFQRLTK